MSLNFRLGFQSTFSLDWYLPLFLGKGIWILVVASLISGCTDSTGQSRANRIGDKVGQRIKIGASFQELNNPYLVVMKESLEKSAASIDAELYLTDAHHDVTKQMNDIEDLIQKQIDILLVNPTDSVGIESAVRSAKQAGIVVVAVDAQAAGPIDSFVGSKNYDAGFQAGNALAESLEGKGEVAILDGIPVVPILERVRGFKDAIAKFPNLKLVDTQNGKQERGIALSVTENMIQSHPDLNGLFSVNDGGALGALSAVEASGKNIAIVSVDGLDEVVDAVLKRGPFKAHGCAVPRDQVRVALGIALAKYWGANVPREIPIDVRLLTAENAQGFSW